MAEEAACGAVVNVVTLIGRQLRYVFCYKGNIKKMKIQIDRLEARRSEVKLLVEAAINNCDVVGSGVELWLKRVEEEKNEVDLVLSDIEKIGKGCLNEWCLHLTSRYWLSRKTTKRTLDLVDLLAQGDFLTVAYPPPASGKVPASSDNNNQIELVVLKGQGDGISGTTSNPASVMGLGITSTSTGISGELKSRSAILGYVMKAVRDVKIHTIGICGMGGVGKTTLVKEVEKRAKEEGLFDEIVFVVVSQNPDIQSIQRDIAELLGLELKQDSLLARARRLHERLNQKGIDEKPKRILILLDDLWKKLDLEEVGIRYPDDRSGCKIVLTSRNMDVCHQMKAAPFRIELLGEEEAWSLFQNFLHPTVSYPIGKAIVAECGGLPIAITTIAAHLANKEESTWNYLLLKLKTSSLQGSDKDVYTVFQVSYDNLQPQEVKDVFLLCCLFPEDSNIPIEDIARYGMGLKVFKKIDQMHEARLAAYAHVEALKKLNLLLESEKPDTVKMHDLVRDFGILIASEDKFLVRFDSGLKRWPVEDTEERCTHIAMQCDGITELPNGLEYSNLKLLQLMCTNVSPFNIPERLDEVAGRLQVLDLRRMHVPSILEVERLTNLRTLSLTNCKLKVKVRGIGNLMQLEILSFAHSTISELPREVGKLSRLRLLDLTGCKMLLKITPGILLGLTFLEELYMRGTKIRWAREYSIKLHDDSVSTYSSYASFAEVEQLCNLIAIEIDIPYQFLPTEVNLESLKKFMITFGGENVLRRGFENSFSLKGDEIFRFKGLLKALCKKTKFLHVSVKDLVSLRNEVEGKDLSRLSTLIFEDCDELACVFDGPDQSFNIRSSPLLLRPFGNLSELTITRCGNLKSVCSPSIAKGFVNLEILIISNCSSIEEIISNEAVGDEDEHKLTDFLKLKTLHLKGLPNLISFCKDVDHEVKLSQLEFVTLQSLPKLTSIDPEMKILGSSDSQHASSTEHPLFHQKVPLNSMAELKLRYCDMLVNVFTSSMILQEVQNLEFLELERCSSLEVVYDVQVLINMNEGRGVVALSPRLTFLILRRLHKLTHVLRKVPHIICQGFQNLKVLEVEHCDKLNTIFSLSIARGMVMLETLIVASCELMEAIFSEETRGEDEEQSSSVLTNKIEFPKLKKLHLKDMPNLVEFCRFVNVVSLPLLEYLYLYNLPKLHSLCIGMKTLVSGQPFIEQKGFQINLKKIEVIRCNNLKRILPLSITRGMDMLEEVEVRSCDTMEEIFSEERGGGEDEETSIAVVASKITFPKLKKLELKALPNLVSFCRSVNLVTFPQLKQLNLIDVPKFHGLCNGMKSLVLDHKVLSQDEHLATIFPANMVQQLHNLGRVEVERNHVVEVVFDLEAFNINVSHDELKALPQLQDVELRELPKLRDVWRKVPPHIQGFYNLKWLYVIKCSSLRYLLTTSMAKALVGLKFLKVSKCNNLESIVSEEEENESAIQQLVLFPQLEGIELKGLPKLLTIAPKTYTLKPEGLLLSCVGDFSLGDILQQVLVTASVELHIKGVMEKMITVFQQIEIPQLSGVAIKDCAELEVVFDFRGLNLNEGHHQAKAFSQLKCITLKRLPKLTSVWKNAPNVIQGFQILEELEIVDCDSLRHLFTPSQAKTLVSLEYLKVTSCKSLEAIVIEEEGEKEEDAEEVILFPQLTRITLKRLPKLTSVCKNAPNVIQGFQNLEELEIVDCDSLRHLFTPSQAKTLVSLKYLTVTSCKSLEAIVIEEEGEKEEEAEEVILFPQLCDIELQNLPSLLTGLPKPYTFKSMISHDSVEERLAYLLRLENNELSY